MLAINIDDVINVINSIKTYLVAAAVVLVLAIVITVAVLKMKTAQKRLIRKETWIAFLLIITVIVNMICFGPMSSMISLATGGGSISDETSSEAKALCTEIAEEGIVLVKNSGNILPLANKKINVFGWSSTNPVYGGTGSGSLSDAYPTVSLLEGLADSGFEVNQDLVDFYTSFSDSRPSVGMWAQDWTIPEPTIADYEEAGIFESAKEYSDTAVIVISRSGGEGADLPTSITDEDTYTTEGGVFGGGSGVRYTSQSDDVDPSKHYLELSNREQAMVERVTSDYSNVVVIINAANAMELGFVNEYPSIKGVILCPGTGQTGFDALGDIMAGTVNPSGKTVDTYVYDLTDTPTYNNFGNFQYDNMEDNAPVSSGSVVIPTFVNYVEGIYVGYRFYETAATEGLINYDEKVVYPFGYGLSYTTFSQEMGAISENNGTISFDVTVTNTGSVAGKDVVEVYYNPPYTNGGIEKSSVNLIAFEKTSLLDAGASETISISFAVEDMASYDADNAKAYVLEAGDYGISIRSDSHTIIAEDTYTVASDVVYKDGRSTDQTAVTNEFDSMDGGLTYLSRADGFANYAEATAAPTNYSMSAENKAAFLHNDNYDVTVYNNADDVMPTTGANNGVTLADMRGLSYDDAKWDDLLDELTVSDMDGVIAIGGYQTAAASSVGKVQTIDCDGPASINNNFTGMGSIGFPAGVMIAATWNKDIAERFGESIGQMADEMDVSGWYAPAMNIHRSAFAGRNFEYYSEDGLLSGKIAAQAIIGAEKYGVYAYMKHFALNDQETNRTNLLCTWADEQAVREIYLKPFEISVKEGKVKAVMSAFNFLGITPAQASTELLVDVLRGEWGFEGFVLTDYYGVYGYQDADRMIRNGNDCMLVAYDTETNHLTDTTSATSIIAARQACKNIMYTVVNSRAYDEENLNPGLQGWQTAFIVVDIIIGLLIVALEVLTIKKYKKDLSNPA
jgi:beta-glucosidase